MTTSVASFIHICVYIYTYIYKGCTHGSSVTIVEFYSCTIIVIDFHAFLYYSFIHHQFNTLFMIYSIDCIKKKKNFIHFYSVEKEKNSNNILDRKKKIEKKI